MLKSALEFEMKTNTKKMNEYARARAHSLAPLKIIISVIVWFSFVASEIRLATIQMNVMDRL